MSTFRHYVRCKDALLDCSAPGGEWCESLTWVDEIQWNIEQNSNIFIHENAFDNIVLKITAIFFSASMC